MACVAVAVLLAAADSSSARKPKVLLAISDDQSWRHAGAYGDRLVNTPNFDRVAREGVLFNYAFCSSPSCTPSRGALLTLGVIGMSRGSFLRGEFAKHGVKIAYVCDVDEARMNQARDAAGADHAVTDFRRMLRADLHDAARPASGLDHQPAFAYVVRAGFLHVCVLAGLTGHVTLSAQHQRIRDHVQSSFIDWNPRRGNSLPVASHRRVGRAELAGACSCCTAVRGL